MKKIIFLVCIFALSACLSSITNAQCKFNISHVSKTNFDNIIAVIGYTDDANIKSHTNQLDIHKEKYIVKVYFKDRSKILSNWSGNPEKYRTWWKSLEIFSDSLAEIKKYEERIPAFLLEKDTLHSRLVKSLPEMQKKEEKRALG